MRLIVMLVAVSAAFIPIHRATRGPEDRALAYYRHSYRGEFTQAYGLLSHAEQDRLSFDDFIGCRGIPRVEDDRAELIRATDGGWVVVIGPKPWKPSGHAFYVPPPSIAVRVIQEQGTWYVILPDCSPRTNHLHT
jgi:hypothetical protein